MSDLSSLGAARCGGSGVRTRSTAAGRGALLACASFALVLTGCSGSGGGSSSPSVAVTGPGRSAAASTGEPSSTATVEKPTSLTVPKINLTHGLKPEGLRDGKVNPLAGEVIWYTGNDRVTPGATGTAVIAGHVADGKKPDAFADLGKSKVGDTFTLTMEGGATQTFEVKRAEVVDKQKLTHDEDVWGVNTSTARVALITCDSELGYGSDGHRKANFVVIGDKVSG